MFCWKSFLLSIERHQSFLLTTLYQKSLHFANPILVKKTGERRLFFKTLKTWFLLSELEALRAGSRPVNPTGWRSYGPEAAAKFYIYFIYFETISRCRP
jgi:hypothetical protein